MILSVSRRTDIPAFYYEWFMNRVRAGEVYVRNPFNYKLISSVPITSKNVDCIVFWTKNAINMINYLDELDEMGFKYYFQYTITPYNKDIEPFADKKKDIIKNFIELSNKIGKEKVILRYDPIFLTEKYNYQYHINAFEKICRKLSKYTNRIVFSYLDDYRKVSRNLKGITIEELSNEKMIQIAKGFVEIANKYDIRLETCAEKIDLESLGIKHSSCIDGELIEEILKSEISFSQKNKFILDKNREDCGCIKCIDIGEYDTCIHNCLYCYANINKNRANDNFINHEEESPILVGDYTNATIKKRNEKDTKSFKINKDWLKGDQQRLL